MFANRPWTSTTGRGCAALGRQAQSFAPGGGVPGCNAAARTLAENRYGTGYCASAPAVTGPSEHAIVATIAAPIILILTRRMRTSRLVVRPARSAYPGARVGDTAESHRVDNFAGGARARRSGQ